MSNDLVAPDDIPRDRLEHRQGCRTGGETPRSNQRSSLPITGSKEDPLHATRSNRPGTCYSRWDSSQRHN